MILVCIEYNLYLCARYLLFASKQKPCFMESCQKDIDAVQHISRHTTNHGADWI